MTETPLIDIKPEEAYLYSLSIRLTTGGLAVYIDTLSGEPHWRGFLTYSSGGIQPERLLQELYYEHEFLSLPFHSCTYLYTPSGAVLAPTELLEAGQESLWLPMVAEERAKEEQVALRYDLPDEGKSLISALPLSLHQYLHRVLLPLTLKPYYSDLLEERRQISRNSKESELLIVLRTEGIDCLLLRAGQVHGYNSYSAPTGSMTSQQAEGLIYYLMALWKHFSLSASSDQLTLALTKELETATAEKLAGYMQVLAEAMRPYLAHISTLRHD